MDLKDYFTLSISLTALVFSIFSLLQKEFETKRLIRSLIGDIVSKLLSAETEFRKIDIEIRTKERAKQDTINLRSIRYASQQQKESLARHAHYLITKVPKLVTDVEFAAVARALMADDKDLADHYWQKALSASTGITQGKHHKLYAQFLFSHH
jgi:hypothetical protein